VFETLAEQELSLICRHSTAGCLLIGRIFLQQSAVAAIGSLRAIWTWDYQSQPGFIYDYLNRVVKRSINPVVARKMERVRLEFATATRPVRRSALA
jgi:hypothetical protein